MHRDRVQAVGARCRRAPVQLVLAQAVKAFNQAIDGAQDKVAEGPEFIWLKWLHAGTEFNPNCPGSAIRDAATKSGLHGQPSAPGSFEKVTNEPIECRAR